MSLRRLLAMGGGDGLRRFGGAGIHSSSFIGMLVELADGITQPLEPYISPVAQMSLAGLCLSASMILLGFFLVGILLARQSRRYGAGYGEAYRLMQKMQFPRAIQLLERVLAGGKITPDTLMLLTSAYAYNGQLAKAQETADRARAAIPGRCRRLCNAGKRLPHASQLWRGGIGLADRGRSFRQRSPLIWAELGFVQQLAGEQDSAIESFKHATLYSMPSMYAVRVNYYLSQFFAEQGEEAEAKGAVKRMLDTRHGLQAWKSTLRALDGTAYGSLLNYEPGKD